MKQIKGFITGIILATVLIYTVPVIAGVAGFKTDLRSNFTNNFTAQVNQDIANAYVGKYPTQWAKRVASGTADTTTNRGIFAVDMIAVEINHTVVTYKKQVAIAAIPEPTGLPDE